MKRLTTRGPAAAEAIRDRIPFSTSGALYALDAGFGSHTAGRLTGPDREAYFEALETIDYVVFSYNTPIAWHSARGWHKVAQKFSPTTSHHQGKLYMIEGASA